MSDVDAVLAKLDRDTARAPRYLPRDYLGATDATAERAIARNEQKYFAILREVRP